MSLLKVNNMEETIITVLDNTKLLKPQVFKEGEGLEPFFKRKKVEEKGKETFGKLPEDFANLANNFESEEEYKAILKREY